MASTSVPKLSLFNDVAASPAAITATVAVCLTILVIVLTVICFVFWKTPRSLSPIITPPASFMVMAMFKNEGHAIREWLQHYAEQGAAHVILIDNGSTDRYQDAIQEFMATGFVTIIKEPRDHVQELAYNDCFEDHVRGKTEWLLVCDLDEFVFGAKRVPLALELLEVPEDVGALYFRWILFGSNGHTTQPVSILKGFTKRLKYPSATPEFSHSKYLVRVDSVAERGLRVFDVALKPPTKSPKAARRIVRFGENRTEASLKLEPIRIHHYVVQSRDWFDTVKSVRGDAFSAERDDMRDAAYFKLFDRNDVEDKSLA